MVPRRAIAAVAFAFLAGSGFGAAVDSEKIERGGLIYREGTCPVCHHWEGQGNRRGPDLTDEEWLHGDGSLESVRKAIENGFRHGAGRRFRGKYEMWPFGGMELDEGDLDALSAFVWSLHRRRRAADTRTLEVVSRVAFAAGADHSARQPGWDTILGLQPALVLLLGNGVEDSAGAPAVVPPDDRSLTAGSAFAALRRQSRFLATWNDPDFSANDAGSNRRRVESQRAFLDFWDEPEDSPRWRQPGMYVARRFGPPGRRLQVILLDTRSGRSPLWRVSPAEAAERERWAMGPYLPNDHEQARMLGEPQWRWLEEQLRQPADLRLVATSIPFVMEFTGWESWANMPLERQRLLDLLRDTGANGVLLLSGGTPWSEFSRLDDSGSYPVWDVTAGSLNRRGTTIGPSRHRVGSATREPNFGYIEVDWTAPDPEVRIELRNPANRSLLRQTIRLSELTSR